MPDISFSDTAGDVRAIRICSSTDRADGPGARTYLEDGIPWCGLFMAVVAKRGGKPIVEGPLWARNWAKFGKAADKAQLGDVLVFRRGQGSGHVGLYVGEDYGAYHVLG